MNDLHHSCELWAEPISLLAAGCLSADEERKVRRHVETCADCRERFGQLTQLCSALAEAPLPVNVAEDAIVERVMSAVASEESRRPLVRTQTEMIQPSLFTRSLNGWRWIMRSPVSRVAAAAIFVLAITGVAMLFQGGGATFAFADFAAPILEAKTVKCKMIVEMKGPPARTITSEVMVLDSARMRQEFEMPDKSKGVMIEDSSQGKSLSLFPASKTATVLTSTNNRNVKTPEYGNPFAGFRSLLLAAPNKPGIEREPLGEKVIDGRRVVGFRISSPDGVFSLWGDPETGLPIRFEMTMGIDGSTKMTFSDFVFNADMDESLFSVEPPAGYTVQYQKSDGSPTEEKSLIEMFREYSNLCDGAFPDSLDQQTTSTIVYKKANIQIQIQSMWEQFAPGKGKPNEEQRHKLEELLLKLTEGNLNEEQIKKIGEQFGEQMQEFIETQAQRPPEVGEAQPQESKEFGQAQFSELQQRVQRGLNFVNGLPANADAHYVGKGVSFGAADTPIFWYRPKDSKKYRVIYADLSVRDSNTPPNVTRGQPVPVPSGPKE
jgi:outer membrane lipoprotein-sorting protein